MVPVPGNLTNGSEVVAKAGSLYSIAFDPHLTSAMEQADGIINSVARFNYSDAGSHDLIGSAVKGLFSDIASALAANQAIAFDMNNYPNRIIAEDMINVNRDTALRNLSIIRDAKVREFISGVV